VTRFNLRRLRAALGARTFVIVVETVRFDDPRSEWDLAALADVVLGAAFVSADTFYDSAALQEGMHEAYRLFGTGLLGIYGLLMLNDSLIGPVTTSLAEALPSLPAGEAAFVAIAVWSNVVISGSGFLLNRPAFLSSAFADYWRYSRFPCGKWGSMALYEGLLHGIFIVSAGMTCYTFTNDIMLLNVPPAEWDARAVPFYKHKNGSPPDAVLRYIADADADPGRPPVPGRPLERCAI